MTVGHIVQPEPTSHHCYPYNTIGADITITGTNHPQNVTHLNRGGTCKKINY
jgi:hypothetical protein